MEGGRAGGKGEYISPSHFLSLPTLSGMPEMRRGTSVHLYLSISLSLYLSFLFHLTLSIYLSKYIYPSIHLAIYPSIPLPCRECRR